MVGHFSSPSAATCVELLHRDNAVRWLAAAIEAFWNGVHFDKAIQQGNTQRMHLACANISPREKPGSHWVALRLSLSWQPQVDGRQHRQVRPETPPDTTPAPRSVARPIDEKLRCLFGTHFFYVDAMATNYYMTRIPMSHELCHNKLQPGMELGPTNSLLLVWMRTVIEGKPYFLRHVIVGPSSVCEGLGLFFWGGRPKIGLALGSYTGKESSLFATQDLAEEYASSMPSAQRNYSLLCKRNGGWVVVDGSDAGDEGFLSFVNDPHGVRNHANTFFDDGGKLCLKSVPSKYDLSRPHESNSAAELLCRYRPDNDFFVVVP
jgi:hypothetical protein